MYLMHILPFFTMPIRYIKSNLRQRRLLVIYEVSVWLDLFTVNDEINSKVHIREMSNAHFLYDQQDDLHCIDVTMVCTSFAGEWCISNAYIT